MIIHFRLILNLTPNSVLFSNVVQEHIILLGKGANKET